KDRDELRLLRLPIEEVPIAVKLSKGGPHGFCGVALIDDLHLAEPSALPLVENKISRVFLGRETEPALSHPETVFTDDRLMSARLDQLLPGQTSNVVGVVLWTELLKRIGLLGDQLKNAGRRDRPGCSCSRLRFTST